MKNDEVDLESKAVWIPDSKTPNGVAEVMATSVGLSPHRQEVKGKPLARRLRADGH